MNAMKVLLPAVVLTAAVAASPAPGGRVEAVPFAPGERLVFDVRFGPVKVGAGSMEVQELVNVRGRTAYHTRFTVRGGTFFYKVNDVIQSWMDTTNLASLRFVSDLEEGSRNREKRYEIYPERQVYVETTAKDPSEQPSVEQPLDDASFLYFIRTVPLRVGEQLEFNRYFRPDRNPVRIRVMRRERVTVPAGTFDAVVLRPSIKTKGIFAENGQAEVWISDDDRRLVLQLKSRLSFGSLNLYLRSFTLGSR